MMVLSKNCLVYIALRTLAASRLVLSKPSGPVSDVAEASRAAADEDFARGADSASAVTDLGIGQGPGAERKQDANANNNLMESERKEICDKIRHATRTISYKNDIPDQKLKFIVDTLKSVQPLLAEKPKGFLESSGGSLKSGGMVHPYESGTLHGMSVIELKNPVEVVSQKITSLWSKSVRKLRLAKDTSSPEFLRELQCYSACIEILFLLRSYMTKYKLESDIFKGIDSFAPQELPQVIKSFVRSRRELLKDFESFTSWEGESTSKTMLESGLSSEMILGPEKLNNEQRDLLLRFVITNKTLQPFHQEVEKLDDKGKKDVVVACWQGLKRLLEQPREKTKLRLDRVQALEEKVPGLSSLKKLETSPGINEIAS